MFKAVDQALAETVGHKLFTLLYVAPDGKRVKRLYTNMPREYPVGGYKPVTESDWHKLVIGQRRAWVGFTYEDVKWAFFDHALIRSLGCESAINVPVVYAGRVLGTMNLLDAAGHYPGNRSGADRAFRRPVDRPVPGTPSRPIRGKRPLRHVVCWKRVSARHGAQKLGLEVLLDMTVVVLI